MDYDKKKYKLHQLYVEQLDKTMKQYPPYKVGEKNTYTRELSLLNGISKQIDELHQSIKNKMTSMSRMIQGSDAAIGQIKKIETNLTNYTSREQLDVTSRQMLADAEEEYNDQKILFFIKLAVFILIVLSFIKQKSYLLLIAFIVISLIFAFFSNLLLSMKA
jgi:hypothetical protein